MIAGESLPCCGCVVTYADPPPDCPCRCHATAQVMWRIKPKGWKK